MQSKYIREQLTLRDRQEMFHDNKQIFLGYGLDVADSYNPSGVHKEVEVC